MGHHRQRHAVGVSAVLALALALGACGDDDSSSGPASTTLAPQPPQSTVSSTPDSTAPDSTVPDSTETTGPVPTGPRIVFGEPRWPGGETRPPVTLELMLVETTPVIGGLRHANRPATPPGGGPKKLVGSSTPGWHHIDRTPKPSKPGTRSTFPGGTVQKWEIDPDDGSMTTTHPDGTVETVYPDGRVTTLTPGGVYRESPPAGSPPGTEGSITVYNDDGSRTYAGPNGVYTDYPDGTRTYHAEQPGGDPDNPPIDIDFGDGTSFHSGPDGTWYERGDGSRQTFGDEQGPTNPDTGDRIAQGGDSYDEIYPDGSSAHVGPEGSWYEDAEGNRTPLPSEGPTDDGDADGDRDEAGDASGQDGPGGFEGDDPVSDLPGDDGGDAGGDDGSGIDDAEQAGDPASHGVPDDAQNPDGLAPPDGGDGIPGQDDDGDNTFDADGPEDAAGPFDADGLRPPEPGGLPPNGAIGEPHYLTQDGVGYTSQRLGEFVLTTGVPGQELQARTEPWLDSESVSAITTLAAGVDGQRVTVDVDGTVMIDGEPAPEGVALEFGFDEGGQVGVWRDQPDGPAVRVVVVWPDLSTAWISPHNGWLDIRVQWNSATGLRHGLLGSDDGDGANDIAARDGTVADSDDAAAVDAAVLSWLIDEDESLFDYADGRTTASYRDDTFPHMVVEPDLSVGDEACGRVAEGFARESCRYDVAVTGDTAWVDAARHFGVAIEGDAAMRSALDAVNAVLEGRAADTTGTPVGGAGETDVDSAPATSGADASDGNQRGAGEGGIELTGAQRAAAETVDPTGRVDLAVAAGRTATFRFDVAGASTFYALNSELSCPLGDFVDGEGGFALFADDATMALGPVAACDDSGHVDIAAGRYYLHVVGPATMTLDLELVPI